MQCSVAQRCGKADIEFVVREANGILGERTFFGQGRERRELLCDLQRRLIYNGLACPLARRSLR